MGGVGQRSVGEGEERETGQSPCGRVSCIMCHWVTCVTCVLRTCTVQRPHRKAQATLPCPTVNPPSSPGKRPTTSLIDGRTMYSQVMHGHAYSPRCIVTANLPQLGKPMAWELKDGENGRPSKASYSSSSACRAGTRIPTIGHGA